MMGVGKSTLGKIVAKRLNLEFVDTDTRIEEKYLMKIYAIFKKKGEKFFRLEEEKEVLKSLKKNNCVIALGGGAFINKTTLTTRVIFTILLLCLGFNLSCIIDKLYLHSKIKT